MASSITPSKILREQALIWKWTKINNNMNLAIHMDLEVTVERLGLKTRKPPWITAKKLLLENMERNTKWNENWNERTLMDKKMLPIQHLNNQASICQEIFR